MAKELPRVDEGRLAAAYAQHQPIIVELLNHAEDFEL